MGPKIVLDTNTLLKVINKEPDHQTMVEILNRVESGALQAIISTITIAEIAVGYHISGDEHGLDNFIQHLHAKNEYTITDVDTTIAGQAAMIRAQTGLRLPDSIIAATGTATEADYLITEDKEFKKAAHLITPLTPTELLDTLNQPSQPPPASQN